MNPTDMNKIDIVQPGPKKACEHFGATFSYCKHEASHPSPIQLDWSSEDWDSEKAKAREHKSLIVFNPPKPDSRQTAYLEIAHNLPYQNLSMHEDKKEEELPEVTGALVPPPEALAATPLTEVIKPENITEENNGALADQVQILQREEEEYAIHIGMLSDEEESNTRTDTDESAYLFIIKNKPRLGYNCVMILEEF